MWLDFGDGFRLEVIIRIILVSLVTGHVDHDDCAKPSLRGPNQITGDVIANVGTILRQNAHSARGLQEHGWVWFSAANHAGQNHRVDEFS